MDFMVTPFDGVIDEIISEKFHNHRRQVHSDKVGWGIHNDLQLKCPEYKLDLKNGVIKSWINTHTPGGRGRKVDLFVSKPDKNGNPSIDNVRICVENKSVITAHRNASARYDDLEATRDAIHLANPAAILVATVMVGTAPRFLNVADRIKTIYPNDWNQIKPRLSSGDQTLWTDFPSAISKNKKDEPEKTIQKIKSLGSETGRAFLY